MSSSWEQALFDATSVKISVHATKIWDDISDCNRRSKLTKLLLCSSAADATVAGLLGTGDSRGTRKLYSEIMEIFVANLIEPFFKSFDL